MSLTPEQRAEKIVKIYLDYVIPKPIQDETILINTIAAHIRDAVEKDSNHAVFYSEAKTEGFEETIRILEAETARIIREDVPHSEIIASYLCGLCGMLRIRAKELK